VGNIHGTRNSAQFSLETAYTRVLPSSFKLPSGNGATQTAEYQSIWGSINASRFRGNCLYLTKTIAMMARLHQPHPTTSADKTNVAWKGADGFTLPWQFTRTSTGSNTARPPNH
jgi:hypothetical protein